jgi:hypothetical protein
VCSLCGILATGPHWSEAGGDRAQTGARRTVLRERLVRVSMLNRALAPFGLSVQEWEETAYVLRSATGETILANDLTGLLVEAERLARRPLDPLDPGYLDRLTA